MKIAQLPKDANDMTVAEAFMAKKLYSDSGNQKEVRRIKVRIQEKFTLPMACIVFGLIGSSLGAKPSYADTGVKGAQVYCFMRASGNNHEVSWKAAYEIMKRQNCFVIFYSKSNLLQIIGFFFL